MSEINMTTSNGLAPLKVLPNTYRKVLIVRKNDEYTFVYEVMADPMSDAEINVWLESPGVKDDKSILLVLMSTAYTHAEVAARHAFDLEEGNKSTIAKVRFRFPTS